MSAADLYGLAGSALVGIGLYGLVVQAQILRKILAVNLLGAGIFLLFGVVARRGAVPGPGPGSDPVPQAMVITGIVVAFAATAIAAALLVRLAAATGRDTLPTDPP